LERKEVGKGLDVKDKDIKDKDIKEKKVTTGNGGKKRTVPGKLVGGGSKTLPLPSKPSSTPPPTIHTSPPNPKSLISTVNIKGPAKIIAKPGIVPSKSIKSSAKSGTLPLPIRRASDTTTPVKKPGVSLENSVGKKTVTAPDSKTNSLPPNNGAKSPEPSTKLPAGATNKPLSSGITLPPRSNSVTSNSSNGPPIKLRGGGKKNLAESEKTSSTSSLVEPSGSVSSTTEPQPSVTSPVITITNSNTSTDTTVPPISSDSARPEEKNRVDGKDTSSTTPITNGASPPNVQDLPSPVKSLSSSQPPVSPLPTTSSVPTPTSTTPVPEVNNKRKSKIVVPPGKGHVLQKLRQNIAVMGSEVQNK
jgi:hypothetical protein